MYMKVAEAKRRHMMPWQQKLTTLVAFWIILVISSSPAAVTPQLITVTSNISAGESICPGEVLLFTCMTVQSEIITWISDEYIGDQIEFDTANNIDETRQASADPNTIATLINNTAENGMPVLVSQLQITVSSIFSTPSVTCVHGSNGIPELSTFQVLVDPDTPQATGHQTDDGGKCTVHISWITPDNIAISDIKDHVIYIDGVNVLNESNTTDTLLSVSYRVRGCAPHNISVGIVNRCGRMGPPSPDVTVSPQPIICEDSVCEVDTDNSSTLLEIPLGVFVVLFVLASAAFIITLIVLFCTVAKQKKREMQINPEKADHKKEENQVELKAKRGSPHPDDSESKEQLVSEQN